MGGLPQAQYSVHSSANPSASGIKYDPLRYGLQPGKYRVKHFGHSTQWRTREVMACVGELLRGLFPPALALNNQGHVDIRVTHVVPDNVVPHHLRPCAFAQNIAGMHGAEASKMPFIVRIGSVRISAKAAYQDSRANWISGVYVRRLPSTCLCLRPQGLQDRRGYCPHLAR
jgi:hypothetical protein